jgi:tungstate transport system ATP-binding protein
MSAILPLSVRGLGFSAGGRALLSDISFDVAPGKFVALMGPNGAGKSLTLRLLHGLAAPSEGAIDWQGGRARAGEAHRHQAMVFQRPILLRRSAAANIDYALDVRGVPKSRRPERVAEALDLVGLSDLAGRQARVLSGGERQLLALARASALNPEVMFLDEPTASLAPAAAKRVEQAIVAIHAAGTTIVMATHDVGQARRLADEILFLQDGRLVERAEAARFFPAPKSREARAYLSGELI